MHFEEFFSGFGKKSLSNYVGDKFTMREKEHKMLRLRRVPDAQKTKTDFDFPKYFLTILHFQPVGPKAALWVTMPLPSSSSFLSS